MESSGVSDSEIRAFLGSWLAAHPEDGYANLWAAWRVYRRTPIDDGEEARLRTIWLEARRIGLPERRVEYWGAPGATSSGPARSRAVEPRTARSDMARSDVRSGAGETGPMIGTWQQWPPSSSSPPSGRAAAGRLDEPEALPEIPLTRQEVMELIAAGGEWRRRRPIWLTVMLTLVFPFGLYPLVWFAVTWAEMKRELRDDEMHPWWHAVGYCVPIYAWT